MHLLSVTEVCVTVLSRSLTELLKVYRIVMFIEEIIIIILFIIIIKTISTISYVTIFPSDY